MINRATDVSSVALFIFLLIIFILLPHGEFTASGESGLDSQKRQNPAVEDIPAGQDGQ
jgi:hypothetical protein